MLSFRPAPKRQLVIMSEEKKEKNPDGSSCDGGEYVVAGPQLPDGGYAAIHHRPDHSVTAGAVYKMESRTPMSDDTVLVQSVDGSNRMEVIGTVGDLKKGPAKVTSDAYRKGWDGIFGKKPTVGQA